MSKTNNVVCPECKADNCIYNDACIKCDYKLIGDDVRLLDKVVEVWNYYLTLPQQHPDERSEMQVAIHRIQDLISVRIARKLTKGIFRDVE